MFLMVPVAEESTSGVEGTRQLDWSLYTYCCVHYVDCLSSGLGLSPWKVRLHSFLFDVLDVAFSGID